MSLDRLLKLTLDIDYNKNSCAILRSSKQVGVPRRFMRTNLVLTCFQFPAMRVGATPARLMNARHGQKVLIKYQNLGTPSK